ncbi:hypothetical protein YC2023_037717 [Brassica napus]
MFSLTPKKSVECWYQVLGCLRFVTFARRLATFPSAVQKSPRPVRTASPLIMLYLTVQRRLGRRAKEKRLGVEDQRRTEAGVSYNSISPRSTPTKDQEHPRVQKSLADGGELKWIPTTSPANQAITSGSLQVEVATNSKLRTTTDRVSGETSGTIPIAQRELPRSSSRSDQSDVQPDSSDVESSDSELEEGEFSKHEPDFEVVQNRKRFSGQKGKRGRGPKIN